MSKLPMTDLSPAIAKRVEAARAEPPAGAVEHAQRELMDRLRASPRVRSRARGPWLAVGATALIALAAFIAIPLLPTQADAFAAVQKHFLDFQTLSMRMEQRFSGNLVQTSNVVVDDRGVVRTDVGDGMSIVVDPVQGRVLTLLHGPRRAMVSPLNGGTASPADSLQWLDEIRSFQGQAERLPGTRMFDDQVAQGWSLQVDGTTVVLWADADGLPLVMQVGEAVEMELLFHFEFDQPLPRGHLSSQVPAGYALVRPDTH